MVTELVFDDDLVRALLRDQHPDLADQDLRPVAGGWDNQLWRLGEDLAVRLPRTTRAPDLLRKEFRWLPELAPRLPLPVPTPVRLGEPSARFPNPWTIARWVPGDPADGAPISRGEHAAELLAAFLSALHRNAPAEAPANPSRGVPLKQFTPDFDDDVHDLAADGIICDGITMTDVLEVWERAVAAPEWPGPPTWLHGDLHPANVVVADGTLAGVVDFGELCAGDPAADLAAAWLLLPAGSAARFFDAYGAADEATIRRAQGWAVARAIGLIDIGRAWERGLPGGKATWGPAGRATLHRALAFDPGTP